MLRDLKTYLAENKVEHLHMLFEELGIDEAHLLAKLKYSDLEKIGVENLIERRKVFDIINEINQDMYSGADRGFSAGPSEPENAGAEEIRPETRFRSRIEDVLEEFVASRSVLDRDDVPIGQRLEMYGSAKHEADRSVLGLNSIYMDENSLTLELPSDCSMVSGERIIVCVRKKPGDAEQDIVDVEGRGVVVNESKLKVDLRSYTEQHRFSFDCSFDSHKRNIDVYRESVRDVVEHVVNGGFGTVLAYGQTGTGKTYTMLERDIGMIYLAIKDLMTVKTCGMITFCEIYMGHVHDLLDDGKKIQLREVNGVVHLANSREIEFRTAKEAFEVIDRGLSLRKTGVTGANVKSSRSHAVILISFGKTGERGAGSIVFVDLAGSERGSDRKDASADTKNEGAEINKSLLALKECIRGIERDHKHLPFRQSKLTQILKNSFVGASKTCLIATISPVLENVEHTLNTLRYAARIKQGSQPETRQRPRSSLESRSEDGRQGMFEEIKRILSAVENGLSSLQMPDLERMLRFCRDLEARMALGAGRTRVD